MFCAIDHCGKTPSDCRSPATRAIGPLTVAVGLPARGGGKGRQQKIGLAVAGETGKPDDFALARDDAPVVRLPFGAYAHDNRGLAASPGHRGGLGARSLALKAAHRADQLGAVEISRAAFRHHLAVAHHDDAVASRQHLTQNVRDQRAADPGVDRAAHIGQQLFGGMLVER